MSGKHGGGRDHPVSRHPVTPSPRHHKDGVLEAIYAPDGRLVAEYPSGGNRSEGDISRFVAEYWRQDHPDPSGTGQALGNTRLAFADFNEDSFIEIKDNPGTGENELEITQAGA